MRRFGALLLVAAGLVAAGIVATQTLGASPSTSIAPITVEQPGPQQENKTSRLAKPRKSNDRPGETKSNRREPEPVASTGGAEPVSPAPVPAGDDDDVDDDSDESDGVDDGDARD